ncbi:MAG: proteasome accessory factor PafA2 family protein [Planctomycetales bacterium]|nr:proteasome accessory factor PafA2 family protein [Planctomycetales bacterium]
MANKSRPQPSSRSPIFQRLIGLETEYALHVPGNFNQGGGSRYGLYLQLRDSLKRLIPAVEARHMKEGIFHAGGGAVWFETERPAAGGGLIEGSTAECRGLKQLLAQQRAQDSLLADAAKRAFGREKIRLLKNDRDAQGNIYGAQENFSAEYASSWRLWLWRAALVAMLPLMLVTWAMLWLLTLCIITYTLLATIVYLGSERFIRQPEGLARFLFGCTMDELGRAAPTGPRWLEGFLSFITRVITAPLAGTLFAAIWLTAFVKVRRQMLPFLLSRAVTSGTGMLDDCGRFHLADKAPAMNCLAGIGGLLADRPIFTFGHLFKTVYAENWLPQDYFTLFSSQQRLQIALGDSNMAQFAEYLRVGTTLLVLDCIEAGAMPPVPRVRRPLRSLRAICADPTLRATVPLAGGGSCTALQLQRFYLEACRRFLDEQETPSLEAREVLEHWEETLDSLEEDPQTLVGSLDWVTKRWVLEKAGHGGSWQTRKKIDLKYHELSPDGYYERLRATGVAQDILTPEEVELARRNPPLGTPATVRGRYIREFAGGAEAVSANWKAVYIGQGRRTKVIRLSSYRRSLPPDGPSKDERVEQPK